MVETVITPQGLARLSEELERLKTTGRSEIASQLQQAASREHNRLEDPDYVAALEDQARLERRIALLSERLRSAQIVEAELGNGRIDVGERVRVRDVESGERLDLELVGPLETDISAGRISTASPLGKAILGRKRFERTGSFAGTTRRGRDRSSGRSRSSSTCRNAPAPPASTAPGSTWAARRSRQREYRVSPRDSSSGAVPKALTSPAGDGDHVAMFLLMTGFVTQRARVTSDPPSRAS